MLLYKQLLFFHICNAGGADKTIKLWDVETCLCVQEYRGHSDAVRDVKVISAELFLSASNDWYAKPKLYSTIVSELLRSPMYSTIRKWNVHTAQCLMEFVGHEAFVYR